ncbi:alkylated DNA repair protein (DNA oxidative demethylase) [Streptomyces griseochromogenes]|uniref:DNA repair protein n=1 Tax=Streptomyces griseochromogenes TaxID=68214 RepID=A0A1B1B2Y3_9ACTN|nr:alpha-ketoglutarate-dependent dioxygenase AlkB [Streptomyces griseochromogenes]ANP53173.1 DNA repair protein [Streptomyces griseochromogenes]MBP2053866.1 alkylated DNA repair protein (DNA oxidative demethylase) [Streptomyces griseochromogenes]
MDVELFPRERAEVAPGAVHVPQWLDAERQRALLGACRRWARPPAGLRTVRTPGGGTMTARQVCLGWHWGVVHTCPACGRAVRDNPDCPGPHWYPYAYVRTALDGDGAPVKPFPAWLAELAHDAVADALGPRAAPAEPYDIALINFYDGEARMGMHRDSDEKSDAPVVSLSLGDSCVFRFGNPRTRTKPYTDVELRSGDLFVFGGPSRLAHHGVPRVHPGTAPPELGLNGRLNITLRVSGL